MSAITPGTGATIGATTIEQFLVAIMRFLQAQERNPAKNPQAVNNVTSSTNEDDATFNATVNIPCIESSNASGETVITATEYLVGVVYSAGTDGTIKSGNAAQALIEATRLQRRLELDSAKNPQGANAITWAFNTGTTLNGLTNTVFSAQFTNLPLIITESEDGGSSSSKGAEYLL